MSEVENTGLSRPSSRTSRNDGQEPIKADVEKNQAAESVIEVKTGKGFYLSRNVIIAIVAGSLLFILFIGLLSGLLFRTLDACPANSANIGMTNLMQHYYYSSNS